MWLDTIFRAYFWQTVLIPPRSNGNFFSPSIVGHICNMRARITERIRCLSVTNVVCFYIPLQELSVFLSLISATEGTC